MGYLRWLIERLRECLDPRSRPYERKVQLWAVVFRLAFIVVPTLIWWSNSGVWLQPLTSFMAWIPIQVFIVRMIGAGVTAWCGAFVWADLGFEERYRELCVGCAIAPNIFPNCTLESYTGYYPLEIKDDDELVRQYNAVKFKALAPFQGDPGSGYMDVGNEETWAVKIHRRWIRPRLIAGGWKPR